MTGLAMVWPVSAERWRRPALVAASIAFHVAVLGYIALRTFASIPPDLADRPLDLPDTLIPVQMEPRPLLDGEKARARTVPPPAVDRTDVQPLTGTPSPAFMPRLRKPDDADSAAPPAPLAPHLSAPARPGVGGAPPPGADNPWIVRPETLGARVARSLRGSSIGCATPTLLSARERVDCDERFGEAAARAAPIEGTGHPERDARFAREGAQALARYDARRRPLSGGVGVVGPQDGPGSNFGMGVAGALLDPSLRPDSTQNIHTRRDGPR